MQISQGISVGPVSVTADTEFPTAAALNGTWAQTTVTTIVGSALMANNGTNEVLVSIGAGTAASALRTTLASDDPAVTALQIMDDWDENDRAKVNLIAGSSSGVAGNSGTTSPATLRVVLASDTTVPNTTGNIAHDNADTGNPVKVGGRAVDPTSLPSAVSANDRSDIYTSLQGETLVYKSRLDAGEDQTNGLRGVLPKAVASNTYTGTQTQNNSFQTTNIKASAGNVLKFSVINTTGGSLYFQLHNTATTPAGGATAAFKYLVPANSQIVYGPDKLGDAGIYFSTGIAIAASSAASTYTAANAGDLLVEITTV